MTESFPTAIRVEVAYALPMKQTLVPLTLAAGSTVEQAIRGSGILARHPEIDLAHCKVGIYGHLVALDAVLADGARIEIYRPLLIDPRDLRRQRAEQAKQEGRADKITGGRLDPRRKPD